jgi:hypothetical protein
MGFPVELAADIALVTSRNINRHCFKQQAT